jgi:hypothetical protein
MSILPRIAYINSREKCLLLAGQQNHSCVEVDVRVSDPWTGLDQPDDGCRSVSLQKAKDLLLPNMIDMELPFISL